MVGHRAEKGFQCQGGLFLGVPSCGTAQDQNTLLRCSEEGSAVCSQGPGLELGKSASQEEFSVCTGSAQPCAWQCGED